MIAQLTAEQESSIERVQAMRAARQAALAAKSTIGPIAVHHALAPLRELIDAMDGMDYPAAHALATAMAGRDASEFTVRGLLALIARIPA